jgi:hypothetical protein
MFRLWLRGRQGEEGSWELYVVSFPSPYFRLHQVTFCIRYKIRRLMYTTSIVPRRFEASLGLGILGENKFRLRLLSFLVKLCTQAVDDISTSDSIDRFKYSSSSSVYPPQRLSFLWIFYKPLYLKRKKLEFGSKSRIPMANLMNPSSNSIHIQPFLCRSFLPSHKVQRRERKKTKDK